MEVAGPGGSRVVRFPRDAAELSIGALPAVIEDAGIPAVSADARRLGFIRWRRGRGQLWWLDRATSTERPVTGPEWDVLDFGFFPDNRVVFAGRRAARTGLFVVGAAGETPSPLAASDRPARYPQVSPDGRWLAYAERDRGNWQLWLLALDNGARRRLTRADCNSISPAWRPDSRNLVYATDCGRGVQVTTLAELRAVP
jgi:dipeptidyl aminopeptidase/acylaminoacyl peptidase